MCYLLYIVVGYGVLLVSNSLRFYIKHIIKSVKSERIVLQAKQTQARRVGLREELRISKDIEAPMNALLS